ncbi:MAG TPA: hypothetical protein VHO06_27865 [Polyangia bacterium]|nr:hypothetical protein [Polyangia bacterium]
MKHASPLVLFVSIGLAAGCAGVKQNPGSGNGGSSGVTTGSGGSGAGASTGAGGTIRPTTCNGPCDDFGGGPFGPDGTSGSVPPGAGQIFGGSGSPSGGPCLYEPQDGTLFPNNWLRPRFSWTATGDLYQLRVSASDQADDLVVYTTTPTWTMPATMWQALGRDSAGLSFTVTISSSSGGGAPSAGTTSTFTVAPVGAGGNLVYWSPTGSTNGGMGVSGDTYLSGFAVGDDSVAPVLTCGPAGQPCDITSSYWETYDQGLNLRPVSCIGCHTSTPDGDFISFNDFYPWGGVLASGQPSSKGMAPMSPILGAGGYKALIQPWLGITTYSPNHWANTDHIVVAPIGTSGMDTDQQPGLAWIDLENGTLVTQGQNPFTVLKGSAWNWIYQPTGANYAAAPSWSKAPGHDFVVFTMTSKVVSGRLGTGTAHLYQVPYSKTAPQTATPVPGDGSAAAFAQYYGTLSGDDAFIVYDQVPAGVAASTHAAPSGSCSMPPCTWDGMYMQPQSELYVIPTGGGSGVRLAANDPPSCPGQMTSPGVDNTWAKWSPQVSTGPDGSTYYWIIFSSWRQGLTDPTTGDPIAQLFMTAVVTSEFGVRTYPAVYLWNQPANTSNFTPAWDVFKIGSVG